MKSHQRQGRVFLRLGETKPIALKPERFFRTGTVVRFLPPPGAYSTQSEQYRQRGKDCLVVRCWNDSHATVTFGAGYPVVVAIDYLWRQ